MYKKSVVDSYNWTFCVRLFIYSVMISVADEYDGMAESFCVLGYWCVFFEIKNTKQKMTVLVFSVN